MWHIGNPHIATDGGRQAHGAVTPSGYQYALTRGGSQYPPECPSPENSQSHPEKLAAGTRGIPEKLGN